MNTICPPEPLSHSPHLGRENITKVPWVKTGQRLLSSEHCDRQNRLDLGKLNC